MLKKNKTLIRILLIFIFIFFSNSQKNIKAYTVYVDSVSSLKDYLSKSETITIYLNNVMQIGETLYVSGNKTIYSQNWYMNNYISPTSGASNAMLHVNSGATLTLNNCYMNALNVSTNSSSVITVGGTCILNGGEFYKSGQGIYVASSGKLTVNGAHFGLNTIGIGNLGTVIFNSGNIGDSQTTGIYNNGGTVTINGGTIHPTTYGIRNLNGGTTKVTAGSIYESTYGIHNQGSLTVTGGDFYSNTNGIYNPSGYTATLSGGNIYSNTSGLYNLGTANVSGGSYYSNTRAMYNTGTLNISDVTINSNTATDGPAIYQNGTCKITGGTFASDQNIYLATDSRYVSTETSTPSFVVKPNSYTRERVLVKTSGETYATDEVNYMSLYPNGNWNARAVGSDIVIWDKTNVTSKYIDVEGNSLADSVTTTDWYGEQYETTALEISGYTLTTTPTNASGTYADSDTTVSYVYDISKGEIEVQYIDEVSGSLLATVTEEGVVGDVYTIHTKEFDGYKLVTEPENKEITFSEEKITVTYGYRKISEGVEIKYINQETGEELLTSELIEGVEGAEYTSSSKEIDGYDLVVIPENANGTMTVEKITVTYEYLLIEGKIIITKVDRNDESKVLSGSIFKIQKLDNDNNIDLSYTATELMTDANGKVEFTDLTIGKYRITETKAPEGYELSEDVIDVEITSENREINVKATDRLKLELPKTGGNLVMFCTFGVILMIASFFLKNYKKTII